MSMIIKIISDAKIHVNTSPFTHETEAEAGHQKHWRDEARSDVMKH
jgi:hypothetical protein